MAYAIKYLFKFESSNGTTREIRVLQDGYTGEVIQRPLGRAPMLKKQQNGPVHGTSLEFYAECNVDREFIEFYTSNPKDYRVDLYAGSTLLWQGYITPELYSEPDIAPPYDVQVVATDGVGELKLYDYAAQGAVTLRTLLSGLLSRTGLGTDIYLISSLKPGSAGAGSLLEKTINLDYMAGRTCYEVLTYILDTLHATITWWKGAWILTRETNVTFTNGKVRYFNTAGNSALLTDSVQALGKMRVNPVWPVEQLSTVIDPAKNKVTVQAPWHTVTCLQNPEMGSDADWTKAKNARYETDGYVLPININTGTSETAVISQATSMAGLRVPMNLSVKATGATSEISAQVTGAVLGVLLTYKVGNVTYHLVKGDDGVPVWQQGSDIGTYIPLRTRIDFQQQLATWDSSRIEAEELTIDNIPPFLQGTTFPAGMLTVYILGYCAKIYGAYLDVVLPKGYQDILRIDNGARGEGSEVEIAIGRATTDNAYYAAFLQGLLLDSGNLITSFSDANFPGGMDYLAFIARDYALSVALPRAKVTGTVYLESGIAAPPLVFTKGALNYWLQTWSWNLYEDELEIEGLTLPSASLTVESETILESTASASSSTGRASGGGAPISPGTSMAAVQEWVNSQGYLASVEAASTYATITALNGVSGRVTTLEGRTNWDTYFGVDENGDIYVKKNGTTARGFYSYGFVSAGGASDGSGTSGVDLAAVWANLTANTGEGLNKVINVAHIPALASISGNLTVSRISDIETWISGKGYLTDHQSLDGYVNDLTRTPESGGNYVSAVTKSGKIITVTYATLPTSLPASDVYSWAKAETKPSYAFSEITGTASASQIPTLAISKISGLQTALDGKQPLDADLTAIAGLTGTSGFLKKTAANTWSLDTNTYLTTGTAASTYQPLDSDLTAIAALTGPSSGHAFLKRKSDNTWVLDSNTYLTGNQTITLSGDVSGSGTTAITTTIGEGKVTNAMLAGSIANAKLANSAITINGSSTSLGGSFSTASITAGTAGTSSATSGLSISVPYVTMNKYGIVTGYGTHTHSISKSDLTTSLESSNGYYVKKSGDTMTGALTVSAQVIPVSMEFRNMSSSAGNGGYIDFHFNNSSADFTTRIIESASGILSISGGLSLGTTLQLGDGVLSWDGSANAWKLTGNFYATGFISAGGVSSGGGASGVDLTAVWNNLIANTGEGLNKKIHTAHLPTVTITGTNISGTGTYSGTGGSASTLTLNLTAVDTKYTNGTGISLSGTTFSLDVAGAKTALGLGSNAYTSTAYLPLAGGKTTGPIWRKMTVDTSNYENAIGWSNAAGTSALAYIGYHNTVQKIYINAIGASEAYSDAVGKYSLVVGNNVLTYNTYPILRSDNYTSYVNTTNFPGLNKTGTVTSVAMTVPTGLSVSGTPITSSGTLAISLASGYSIPTTAKQSNWDTAYGWGNHASAGYLLATTAASTYVSSVALNGNYLRVTKDGANTDLTIPYATKAQIPNWLSRTAFDPNAVEHAIESNYGEPGSTRSNVPSEFLYGSVLTLSARGFDSSLSAQFLWDVRHGTSYPGWLWFRTKDSSSGWRDWTPVYTGLSLTKSVVTGLIGSETYAPYNVNGYLPLTGGTMNNTNVVTNLNADLLDGLHATDFVRWYKSLNATDFTSYFPTAQIVTKYGSTDGLSGDGAVMTIPTWQGNNANNYYNVQFVFGLEPTTFRIRAIHSGSVNYTNTVYTTANANLSTVDWACKTLTASGNISTSGYVSVGTGGANSYVGSDAATNIFLHNSSGYVLVVDGVNVRRGGTATTATLGNSTYPWAGITATSADFRLTNFTDFHIYRNNSEGSAGITYYSAAQTASYWNVGMDPTGTAYGGRFYWYYTGSYLAYLTTTGNFVATGAITAGSSSSSSDARLKSNIKPFSYSSDLLLALKPREWDWNEYSHLEGHSAGIVAQEIQGLMPYAVGSVSDEKFGEHLTMNYDTLHALEIAGLQDHESRIRQLEAENRELRKRLNMN